MDGSNCVNDDDVWFDSPNHPGTKVYRKTIRLVVDEFLHEEYSKSIYKAMKSKLNGRKFYSGDPPHLCHGPDVVNIFGDSFEKERTRRKEKQRGKARERKSRSLVRKNSKSPSQSSHVSENNKSERALGRKSRSQSSLIRKNNDSERALGLKSHSQSSLVSKNKTSEGIVGRKSPSRSSLVSDNNTPEITLERKSRLQSSLVRENNTPEITLERNSRLRSSLFRENNTSKRALGFKSPSRSSLVSENNTPEITLERKSHLRSSLFRENNSPERALGRKSHSQSSLVSENTPERSVGRNKSRSQSSLPHEHTRENSDGAEAFRRSELMGRSGEPPGRRGSMLAVSHCDTSREPLKQCKSQGSKHPRNQDLERQPDRSESSQGSTDDAKKKSRKLLEKSRKLLNRMEEAKETLSFEGDDHIYLDEENRPGTQALQEVVKRAVSEFSQEEYSSSIFKWIRKELRGRQIFQTLDSQFVEASKKDLVDILGDLYECECRKFTKTKRAETCTAQAKKRDVYFDVPDHSGTKAWKRVVRHFAEDNPDEIFCKDIFTEIRLQLDGSSYYTGKPPTCLKARKQDILIRFGECFDDEKASIMGKKDKSSEGALRQRYCDSTKSETECSDANLSCISDKRRPVPGYLYWILLRQIISNRLARWDWYQRTSHDLCRRVATNSIVVRMQPYGIIIKEACGKDPESGEDVFDRLAAAIEVKVFGRRWPFILLIGGLCAIGVFSIIYTLGQKVLLGLL